MVADLNYLFAAAHSLHTFLASSPCCLDVVPVAAGLFNFSNSAGKGKASSGEVFKGVPDTLRTLKQAARCRRSASASGLERTLCQRYHGSPWPVQPLKPPAFDKHIAHPGAGIPPDSFDNYHCIAMLRWVVEDHLLMETQFSPRAQGTPAGNHARST